MGLSQKKLLKIERDKRTRLLDGRSLNGKGYWMDANHEYYARQYLATGDSQWLEMLPDYSHYTKKI